MTTSFTGFLAGDFDAYTPEKWSSNMWNRQRLEVKQRAVVLGKEIAQALENVGAALSLGASDEHPSLWNKKKVDCQWVFLWRNDDERKVLESVVDRDRKLSATLLDPTPFFRHAFLAMRLDAEGLEVALKVHRNAWVDATNLRRKLQTAAGRAEALRLFAALPPGFTIGVGEEAEQASTVGPARVSELLSRHDEGEWFFASHRTSRDEAIEAATDLAGAVAADFERLWPLYRFLAWSRDNDYVSIDEALAAEAAERQIAHERIEREESERLARIEHEKEQARERAREMGPPGVVSWPPRPAHVPRAGGDDRGGPPPATSPEARPERSREPRAREERARTERPRESRPEARGPRPSRQSPRDRDKPADAERAAKPATVPPAVAPVPKEVAKGVRVRIGTGPFAGKVGTVQEIDKGVAKVLLGLMAARVDVADLVPVGGGQAQRRRA